MRIDQGYLFTDPVATARDYCDFALQFAQSFFPPPLLLFSRILYQRESNPLPPPLTTTFTHASPARSSDDCLQPPAW